MEILLAVIGGGAGAAIMQLISVVVAAWQKRKYEKEDKHDAVQEQLAGVQAELKRLAGSIEQRDAISARTHILRFDDELRGKVRHSQEYFRQILEDIDTYNEYCESHEGFRNGYTTAAVRHIREIYDRCLAENSFI